MDILGLILSELRRPIDISFLLLADNFVRIHPQTSGSHKQGAYLSHNESQASPKAALRENKAISQANPKVAFTTLDTITSAVTPQKL